MARFHVKYLVPQRMESWLNNKNRLFLDIFYQGITIGFVARFKTTLGHCFLLPPLVNSSTTRDMHKVFNGPHFVEFGDLFHYKNWWFPSRKNCWRTTLSDRSENRPLIIQSCSIYRNQQILVSCNSNKSVIATPFYSVSTPIASTK